MASMPSNASIRLLAAKHEQIFYLAAEGDSARPSQSGDVHNRLHPALLLRVPQRIRQRESPLRIRVIYLRQDTKLLLSTLLVLLTDCTPHFSCVYHSAFASISRPSASVLFTCGRTHAQQFRASTL